jgi:UDP-hydrolysing UDP-N-acetyl-D-glucosamine 2-epimerase
MHLVSRYGKTITQVLSGGFVPVEQLDWLGEVQPDPPVHIQMGIIIRLMAEALKRVHPDFLILVGDRYETTAAALAAVICHVPIVHLHGGEETVGSLDNLFRHAITKMSHLHLVSHYIHANRIIQMGEAPESVHIVGAPGLDNLFRSDLPDKDTLETLIGIKLEPPVVIVTLHPVTINPKETTQVLNSLISAMSAFEATYIITLPNSDSGNDEIRTAFQLLALKRKNVVILEALGEQAYFSLMSLSDLMVGNSSSGLIEAGAYQLPVIDIGSRQQGRVRGQNVIHVEPDPVLLSDGFRRGLSSTFKESLAGTSSPYGDGKVHQRSLKF